MVTFDTDRLTLRMLRETDFDAYAEMCADQDVMCYIGDGQPLTRPLAWRKLALMIGHWALRGYGLWAVEERSSRLFVGYIGLWNPEGWPGFELGWTLRRSFWGRGFATEGAQAALQFAFTELQQSQVISLIHPENAASIRVAQRLGERWVDSTEVMGQPVSVYRITRGEWEGAKPTQKQRTDFQIRWSNGLLRSNHLRWKCLGHHPAIGSTQNRRAQRRPAHLREVVR